MAAALVVPATGRIGQLVTIGATGFEADGDLLLSIDELAVSGSFLLDNAGDLASPSPLAWLPTKVGTYTIRAGDGTTNKSAQIRIYTNS